MARKNRSKKNKGPGPVIKSNMRVNVPERQKGSKHPRPRISYINTIPDDVLFNILVELGLPGSMTSKMSTVLTSICKRWRLFVLNSPLLWTEISDPFGVKLCYPDALNPFERSKPALIDIVWDLDQYGDFMVLEEVPLAMICDKMAPHCSRFQRLALTSPSARVSGAIFDAWQQYPMPPLKSLIFKISQKSDLSYFPNRTNSVPEKPLPLLWVSTSSVIQTIRLENVDIHHFPQLSISHLDIKSLPPTFESFKLISTKFPELQTLVFRPITDQTITQLGSSRTTLNDLISDGGVFSKLRSLAICIQSSLSVNNSADYALARLSTFMRSVEYVEIVCSHTFDKASDQWREFLKQWVEFPKLTRMKINFSHSSLWTNLDFLSSLPHRTSLEIDFPPVGSEHTLVKIMNFSNLRDITIILAQPASRWLPHKPLASKTFAKKIKSQKPILTCPTTIQLSQKQFPPASSPFFMLGPLLTIVLETPHTYQPRLIDTTSEDTFLKRSNMKTIDYSDDDHSDWQSHIQTRQVWDFDEEWDSDGYYRGWDSDREFLFGGNRIRSYSYQPAFEGCQYDEMSDSEGYWIRM